MNRCRYLLLPDEDRKDQPDGTVSIDRVDNPSAQVGDVVFDVRNSHERVLEPQLEVVE